MKIKPLHPLVSCICITKNRPDMLLKTVLSFDQQNYPNRELIISYQKNDKETKSIIDGVMNINGINIIPLERSDEESIGTARNNALKICNGDYICAWDDDDLHYFSRIADQYNLLQGNGRYFQSSIITQIVLFDSTTNKAYLSFPNLWQGSLLCKKEHLLQYPCTETNQFECTPVINYLSSKNLILELSFNPLLYTYVYHGSNIIDYFHFQYLVKRSRPFNDVFSREIREHLDQKIKLTMS